MSRWGGFAKLMVISVHCSQTSFADNGEEALPLRCMLKAYSDFIRIQLEVGTHMFEFILRGYKRDIEETGQTYIYGMLRFNVFYTLTASIMLSKAVDSQGVKFDLSIEIKASRRNVPPGSQVSTPCECNINLLVYIY